MAVFHDNALESSDHTSSLALIARSTNEKAVEAAPVHSTTIQATRSKLGFSTRTAAESGYDCRFSKLGVDTKKVPDTPVEVPRYCGMFCASDKANNLLLRFRERLIKQKIGFVTAQCNA